MTCCFIITLNKNVDRVGSSSSSQYPYNYCSAVLCEANKYSMCFILKYFIPNVFPPPDTREKKNKTQKQQNKINALTEDIVSPSVIKLMRKGDAKVTVQKDWGCSGDRKSMLVFSPLCC